MTTIYSLIQEHERLTVLASRIVTAVAGTRDTAADAIGLKVQLSAELAAHLASEDACLYEPMIASGDMGCIGPADGLRRELEMLRDDFAVYVGKWSDDAVMQDWDRFADETRAIMTRLSARIERENSHLFPLALQKSTIRLGERPAG